MLPSGLYVVSFFASAVSSLMVLGGLLIPAAANIALL